MAGAGRRAQLALRSAGTAQHSGGRRRRLRPINKSLSVESCDRIEAQAFGGPFAVAVGNCGNWVSGAAVTRSNPSPISGRMPREGGTAKVTKGAPKRRYGITVMPTVPVIDSAADCVLLEGITSRLCDPLTMSASSRHVPAAASQCARRARAEPQRRTDCARGLCCGQLACYAL